MPTNTIRPEVLWFAEQMEYKLRHHDHKGHWSGCRISHLFPRLQDERDELLLAIQPLNLDTLAESFTPEQAEAVIKECADIANFAMMIADLMAKKSAE